MPRIQLRDAKATLSAVVDRARDGEPTVITRHGRPEAVVLGFEEWQRLARVPSFGRLLMEAPLEDGDLPQRGGGGGGLRPSGLSRLYLVDTNVLSASAPTKAEPRQALQDWMERNSDRLTVSVISIAEIEDGIARSRRTGATAKAARLADWLDTVLHLYAHRVLPIDIAIARRIGALMDLARGAGHDPGLADVAIAATALDRGCTILTRNLRHFAPLGVRAVDPFDATPSEDEA